MTAADKPETAVDTTDQLLAELDRPNAEAWIPKKPGDTLIGYLKDIGIGSTQYGTAPFLLVVDDQGVEHSVWVFVESLKSALRALQPQRGERIAVRYNGEKKVKNPTQGRKNSFHDYRLAVDRPASAAAAIDWNATLAGGQAEPAETPEDEIPF